MAFSALFRDQETLVQPRNMTLQMLLRERPPSRKIGLILHSLFL